MMVGLMGSREDPHPAWGETREDSLKQVMLVLNPKAGVGTGQR